MMSSRRRASSQRFVLVLLGLLLAAAAVSLGRRPSRDGIPHFAAPAGWRMEREEGRTETYHEVRFLGPRNGEDTYTAFMAIRARPLRAAQGWSAHIEELMRQTADGAVEGAVVDGPHPARVAGVPAQEVTVSATIVPPTPHGGQRLPVPLKTRALFFEQGDMGYEVVYGADAREYARSEPAFTALLDSFVIR